MKLTKALVTEDEELPALEALAELFAPLDSTKELHCLRIEVSRLSRAHPGGSKDLDIVDLEAPFQAEDGRLYYCII